MASVLRYSAVAALLSSAFASAIEALPSQTLGSGGYGTPLGPEPTGAPAHELVKMRFEKRSVTNICTEWTIPGGFGQPECYNSATCLFTSANGLYYEGCGQTSIGYDWITDCYNWPQSQSGTQPVSQTWCDSAAPYCGYFAFVFGLDYTYYNYGCSTISYALYVDLLDTTTAPVLAGNEGTTVTVTATPTFVSQSSANSQSSSGTLGSGSTSITANPNPASHTTSKSTPIGAIVGGVIGGVALIAFIAFLVWFFLRKKRQDAANAAAVVQQQQDTAAQFQPQRISEIGGNMLHKPPMATTYNPQSPQGQTAYYPEKPVADSNTQEVYQQGQPETPYVESQNSGAFTTPISPGSPPPTYTQPHQPSPITSAPTSPPQGYTELEHPRDSYVQAPPPPVSPIQGTNELENTARASYAPPPNVSEVSGTPAAASGGVNRKPASKGQGAGGFDMSGAPLGEGYVGHELE